MSVELKIDQESFRKLFQKVDMLPQAVHKDMGRTILDAVLLVESAAKQKISQNFKGKGELAASITHKIMKSAGLSVSGQVGTNLAYAAIHEFGGTIEPKNSKWLTIPFEGIQGRARDYTDTFFQWKKGAEGQTLILFQNVKGGAPLPLFVLVKRSEVPARPYLNPALKENASEITNNINKALKRSLQNVSRK